MTLPCAYCKQPIYLHGVIAPPTEACYHPDCAHAAGVAFIARLLWQEPVHVVSGNSEARATRLFAQVLADMGLYSSGEMFEHPALD